MTTMKLAAAAILLLTWVLTIPSASPATAGAMGESLGHDLDALWVEASRHDLSALDAVHLLESRTVTIEADGAVATRVHRVVWIGTAVGLRTHADLRVPWNSSTSALTVERLRTYREGQWRLDPVVISETAVVHTLPHAVNRAHDYTTMRETMLLHDGIELPCILETAYTIVEQAPAAGARTSDHFVLPQRDPSVLTVLAITAPASLPLAHLALNGAPAPEVSATGAEQALVWRVHGVPARTWPSTRAPLLHEPAIVWTTWPDHGWQTAWNEAFTAAALSDPELQAAAAQHLDLATGLHAEIDAAVRFLDEAIRPIRYDDGFWPLAPRPAGRTWATGYGHALDRAAVLAAVLQDRGHTVTPVVLVEAPAGMSGEQAPALGAALAGTAGDLYLLVAGDVERLVDVATGAIHGPGHRPSAARLPLTPQARFTAGTRTPGQVSVSLVLVPDSEGGWSGTGEIKSHGDDDLHDAIITHTGDLDALIQPLATGILSGASVSGTLPRHLAGNAAVLAFELSLPPVEDDEERVSEDAGVRLMIGAPRIGLLGGLPADVNLVDRRRTSPVLLTASGVVSSSVRLRVDADRVRHLPATQQLVNRAGSLEFTTSRSGDWLTCTFRLEVAEARLEADLWPDLRALLLEAMDPVRRTLVLEPVNR